MKKIYFIEPIVKEALTNNPQTRGDNFLLYNEVLKQYVDTRHSFEFICEKHVELGIPSLETITRCRRKLQEKNPDLRDKKSAELRQDIKQDYINYSEG